MFSKTFIFISLLMISGAASATFKNTFNDCLNFTTPNGASNPPLPPIIGNTVDEVNQQCENQCNAYPQFICTVLGIDQTQTDEVPQFGYFQLSHSINVDLTQINVSTGAVVAHNVNHFMTAFEFYCKDGYVQTRGVETNGTSLVVPFIDCQQTEFHQEPVPVPDTECEKNPCHPTTGNKSQQETDIANLGTSGLTFSRFYNSLGDHNTSESLAHGWRHTFSRRLNESTLGTPDLYQNRPDQSSLYDTPADACVLGWQDIKNTAWNGTLAAATVALVSDQDCQITLNGKTVAHFSIRPNVPLFAPLPLPDAASTFITVSRPNGQIYHFEKNTGVWSDPLSPEVFLIENGNAWTFTDTDSTQEQYNTLGNLVSITDLRGNTQTLSYDTNDRLDRVDTTTGEYLQFGYDTSNRISTITDHTSRTWTYRYDANGNLEFVDNSDGTTKQYHYEDPNFTFALTGITDERQNRFATWAYNADGKAILSEHAGTERVDLTYNPDGTTTVTGSRGDSRTYHFAPQQGQLAVIQITGDLCTDCPNGDKKDRSYDANGYLSGYTDWSNAITEMGNYDAIGQLGFKIEAKGTLDERRNDYSYDPRFNNKTTTVTAPSVFSP